MGHGEQVTATGAWHIRPKRLSNFRFTLDTGFANALASFVRSTKQGNASIGYLDVGAGIGRYVRHLRDRGVHAQGVDGIAGIRNLTGGLVAEHDPLQLRAGNTPLFRPWRLGSTSLIVGSTHSCRI